MNDYNFTIKVALSTDFLKAMNALPSSINRKVQAFIDKFKFNPKSSGINFEKIRNVKDSRLHSVRIDQTYRAIVMKPKKGDAYVLLWVDHHDKAYQWAENRVTEVHPETGTLQIYTSIEGVLDSKVVNKESTDKPEGLFTAFRDRKLTALGIPEPLLPLVRSFKTKENLEKTREYLPEEAYEALFWLSEGIDYEEIWRERDLREREEAFDTEDVAAALERTDSKRQFYVVENDLALTQILNAPLEQWRVFLHPTQRRLVEKHFKGSVRVLGGAGTGKTVVAMHRAKYLAESAADNETILFTTFTKNLAADIKHNLTKICSPDVLRRIEVVNLDKWVVDFLKANDYSFKMAFGNAAEDLWEDAMTYAPVELPFKRRFYEEEWEQVIQPNGIKMLQDYLRIPRMGRWQRLTRKDRSKIWIVFEEYRSFLNDHNLKEREDIFYDAIALLNTKGDILNYKSIIVDEAQDMGLAAFRLIRSMIPDERANDLFIVGDAHQRIYRHKVVLSHCGINIRGARGRKLRINYRTTEENRRWAVALLKDVQFDDLDGGIDTQKGYKSLFHGPVPKVCSANHFEEELDSILTHIFALIDDGAAPEAICIVARKNDILEDYAETLAGAGLEVAKIEHNSTETQHMKGIRLATMHRVKGLEFDHVLIAGVNDGIVPLEYFDSGEANPARLADWQKKERALLYVAVTRAKKSTMITSHGSPSPWITDR